MDDPSSPSTAEKGTPAPDDASAPDESPNPDPPLSDNGPPPPDDASMTGTPPRQSTSAEPFRLRRVGASIGALGALLVLCGALLPTYGSGDYERAALKNVPLILVALLIVPTLFLLGISVTAWFRNPPLWLVTLGCLVIILVVWVHWLVEALFASFACFDVCPPGGVHAGTGFWLPLVGFPLSGVGIVFAALASVQWRPKQAAQAT